MSLLILFPAQSGTHHTIDGAVTVTATPAAELARGRVIAGAVTITITPAAAMSIGRVITGDVAVTATPAASFADGDVIAGAVEVSAVPAADMEFTPASGGGEPAAGPRFGGVDPRLAKLLAKKRPKRRPRDAEPVPVYTLPDTEEDEWEAVLLALLD